MRNALSALALLALTAFSAFGQDTTETIPAGQTITLVASADGVPAPTFEWYKNGAKLSEGPYLILPSITANDSATYHVVAKNSEGSAQSANYVLIVDDKTPPILAMAPLDATIKEGESLKLSVVATGNPAPTYQWKKNGVDIPGATSSFLAFIAISRGDAGSYTVTVTNEKGSVTSSPAVLTVLYPPSAPIITRPLSNVMVPKKTDVILSIDAKGEELAYQWRKGSSNLVGKTTNALVLQNVNPSAEGTYTVTVRNPHGSGSSSARLTVLR